MFAKIIHFPKARIVRDLKFVHGKWISLPQNHKSHSFKYSLIDEKKQIHSKGSSYESSYQSARDYFNGDE